MSDPKKLDTFYQELLVQLNVLKTQLEFDLADIQTDGESDNSLQNAERLRQEWSGRIDGFDLAIASSRAAMVDPLLAPADVEALAERVRFLLIERRGALSVTGSQARLINELETLAADTANHLEHVDADIADADASLELANARSEQLNAWFPQLTEQPLIDLKAAATDALNAVDGPFQLAESHVNDDIPGDLGDRVQERLDDVLEVEDNSVDALADLNTKLGELIQAASATSATVDEKLTEYDHAVEALTDLVMNGQHSLEIAISNLESIAGSDPLTAAQNNRVTALMADPDIATHFLHEKTRNDLMREVDKTRQELLVAEASLRADDPDISVEDVEDHATVKPLRELLFGTDTTDGLEKDLENAELALGFGTYETLVEAEKELQRLEEELANATAELLQEDPEADPATHPDLDPFRQAVIDQTEGPDGVNDALAAFGDSSWYQLEQLEVAIPETTWANVKQLHDERQTLERLSGLPADLNDMKTAVEDAEDALVDALAAESNGLRSQDHLNHVIDRQRERIRWLTEQRQSLTFNAARGVD